MASTLALGSSGYDLLEADSNAKVSARVRRGVDQAVVRAKSGVLDGFGIGGDVDRQNVSLRAETTDLRASLGGGSDSLSLGGGAENALILLDDAPDDRPADYQASDDGNDQLTATSFSSVGDFQSYVWAGGGDDTIRVTGSADGTLFDLGDDDDVLNVSGSSANLNVAAGAGDDSLQFNGGVGASVGSTSRIDAGAGSDTVVLNGGVENTDIFLGAGDDSLVVRGGGKAFGVDASQGADTISLSGDFTKTYLGLGGGDRVSVDGLFSGSVESNSSGDTLVFGSYSTVENSIFAMGGGNDSLVFGSTVDDSFIGLGAGDDTVVFGKWAQAWRTEVDLSGGGEDHIYLGFDLASDGNGGFENFENFVITGAEDDDVLWVGSSTLERYGYSTTGGGWIATDQESTSTFNPNILSG
jgi:hypothetical protein